MKTEEECMAECPVRVTVKLIGGKYKSVVLWNLRSGPMRYSQIQARVPEATGKMITKQLRELEADGLVSRTVYPEVPPRTEYALTPLGESLMPIIADMCRWGIGYMDSVGMPVADCARETMENMKKGARGPVCLMRGVRSRRSACGRRGSPRSRRPCDLRRVWLTPPRSPRARTPP